jgi:hypothetical protein
MRASGVTFTRTLCGVVTALNGHVSVPLANGQATLNPAPKVGGQYSITPMPAE